LESIKYINPVTHNLGAQPIKPNSVRKKVKQRAEKFIVLLQNLKFRNFVDPDNKKKTQHTITRVRIHTYVISNIRECT